MKKTTKSPPPPLFPYSTINKSYLSTQICMRLAIIPYLNMRAPKLHKHIYRRLYCNVIFFFTFMKLLPRTKQGPRGTPQHGRGKQVFILFDFSTDALLGIISRHCCRCSQANCPLSALVSAAAALFAVSSAALASSVREAHLCFSTSAASFFILYLASFNSIWAAFLLAEASKSLSCSISVPMPCSRGG